MIGAKEQPGGGRRRTTLLCTGEARCDLAVAEFLPMIGSGGDEPGMLDERRLEGGVGNHGREYRDSAWHRSALCERRMRTRDCSTAAASREGGGGQRGHCWPGGRAYHPG